MELSVLIWSGVRCFSVVLTSSHRHVCFSFCHWTVTVYCNIPVFSLKLTDPPFFLLLLIFLYLDTWCDPLSVSEEQGHFSVMPPNQRGKNWGNLIKQIVKNLTDCKNLTDHGIQQVILIVISETKYLDAASSFSFLWISEPKLFHSFLASREPSIASSMISRNWGRTCWKLQQTEAQQINNFTEVH